MKQQIVCCIISMFAPKDAPCSSHFARLRKESSIKDGSVHISSAVRPADSASGEPNNDGSYLIERWWLACRNNPRLC